MRVDIKITWDCKGRNATRDSADHCFAISEYEWGKTDIYIYDKEKIVRRYF